MHIHRISLATTIAVLLMGAGAGCEGREAPTQPPVPQAPAAAPATAAAQDARDDLDVPYVPTPTAVVDKMLEMAKVKKDDVLYDLGSGDGRIVITAAQKYGARGIGYDLNPQRIKESNEYAQKARVTDRVRFAQQDLFTVDLGEATVVTLYLLPEVNLKLRPKLLKELKPGTRVVSHNYDMGDWAYDDYAEVTVAGTAHYVYLWTIPAAPKPGV
jgi:hypothetical protein